jgi:hypothetical protein
VESALLAGEALADDAGILVDPYFGSTRHLSGAIGKSRGGFREHFII